MVQNVNGATPGGRPNIPQAIKDQIASAQNEQERVAIFQAYVGTLPLDQQQTFKQDRMLNLFVVTGMEATGDVNKFLQDNRLKPDELARKIESMYKDIPGLSIQKTEVPEVKLTDLPQALQTQLKDKPVNEQQTAIAQFLITDDFGKLSPKQRADIVNYNIQLTNASNRQVRANANQAAVADVQRTAAEAARLQETRRFEGNGVTVSELGNAEAAHQTQLIDWSAPTEKVEVEDKDEVRAKIKENVSFTHPNKKYLEKQADGTYKETNIVVAGRTYKAGNDGVEITGKDLLDNIRTEAKEEMKAAKKEMKAAQKELDALFARGITGGEQVDAAYARIAAAAARYEQAGQIQVESNRAYKTAKGNGTRAMARAIVRSERTDNDIVDRPIVVRSEAEKRAILANNPSLTEDNIGVLNFKDAQILSTLKSLADTHLRNIERNPSVASAEERQKWEALSRISLPLSTDSAEEVEAKTRANQAALRFLSGLDNTIDPTEKRTMREELHKIASHGEINHLYKTYNMHYTTRLEYKALDAAKAALDAAPAAALSSMAMAMQSVTAIAKADAFVNGTITAEGKFHFQKTVIQQAIAFAEAYVPGFTLSSVDPETGLEIVKQIAGQYASDEQIATAIAEIDEEVFVSATKEYHDEAHAFDVAKGHPSFGSVIGQGALVIGTAALVGFLRSKGNEHGVTSGDAKQYKDALFVQMHNGAAAQGLAQQLIEQKNRLIEKGVPEAQANDILAQFYEQAEGGQNAVMKLTEMGGLLRQFTNYVNNYTPGEKPKVEVVPDPEPLPEIERVKPEEETTPPPTTPEVDPKPEIELEERTVIVTIPYIQYGGPWHYSKLYVDENGNPLNENDRKQVQKYLTGGHLSVDGRNKTAKLDSEITLPNGKTVKLADNYPQLIPQLTGRGGGRNVRFEHNSHGEGRIIEGGQPGPWQPIDQARQQYNERRRQLGLDD